MTARTDTLLSIGQAAEKLRVSISTLRRWDESGAIAAVRTSGGQRRYRLHDLENFINGVKTRERRSLSLMDAFKPQYLLYTIVSTIITAQLLYLALLYTPLKMVFSGQQSIAVPFSRALIYQTLSTGTYAYHQVFTVTTKTAEESSYILATTFWSALKTFPHAVIPSDMFATQIAVGRDTIREAWYQHEANLPTRPDLSENLVAFRLAFDRWGRLVLPPHAQGIGSYIAEASFPKTQTIALRTGGQVLGEKTTPAKEFLRGFLIGALTILDSPLGLLGK